MVVSYLIAIAAWPAFQVPASRYLDEIEKRWVLFVPPDETLHDAVGWNQVGRVKALVEAGQDIDGRNFYGKTPLHVAVSFGNVELARYLIGRGADLERRAFHVKSRTALHTAAYHGSLNMARVLVEAGAEVEARDSENNTPLLLAAFNGHGELVEYFVERGADVTARGVLGYNALCWPSNRPARTEAYDRLVRLYVAHGGDLNVRSDWGCTPLMEAAASGASQATLEFMIAEGADLAAVDHFGKTAADWVRWRSEVVFPRRCVSGDDGRR